MKKRPTIDLLDFKSFLEKEIFKNKLLSLTPFQKGASSFNYLALSNKKYIVKLAWKHQKEGVERLINIIKTLSQKDLTPPLMTNTNNLFCYQECYGFISEYKEGKSPQATKLSSKDLTSILEKYFLFSQIVFDKNISLMDAYPINKTINTQIKILKIALRQKNSVFNFFLKWLLKDLSSFQQTSLTLQAPVIIHGDFTHNNILKTKNDFYLIDFEDLGYGQRSEDLIRFLLAWRARLPIFYFYHKKQQAYLKKAQKLFNLSENDWLVGLNSFIAQKCGKVIHPSKLKPSISCLIKVIKLICFLKTCQSLKKQLAELTH